MHNPARIETDTLGEVSIPEGALYGPQTQRAVENFPISGLTMPRSFLRALGLLKYACAYASQDLQLLDRQRAEAIQQAALAVAAGYHDDAFPVDVFQTGSGTSTNMNANEVIARLAAQTSGLSIHPNDHVNKGQSSNDVIPSCIHIAALLDIHEQLQPALEHLTHVIKDKAHANRNLVKTGRTHLMDALPLTVEQEICGWAAQILHANERIIQTSHSLFDLAIGGTAVGTGVNAHPEFAGHIVAYLNAQTGLDFRLAANRFEMLSAQDAAVAVSGLLRTLAVSLMKISNDLRWMNSGPLAGLGEIHLPALQPGSSIMPGKVNPVIPEAVAMVCAQVIGNDVTITLAGQSGNFQLNVMLPVIAYNLLQSINLLANAARLLADKAIDGMYFDQQRLESQLSHNPVLVTALNDLIGYEKGAEIVRTAYDEQRPLLDVAVELTGMDKAELAERLNPLYLTHVHRGKD
jgi:fumarate hydratase class II